MNYKEKEMRNFILTLGIALSMSTVFASTEIRLEMDKELLMALSHAKSQKAASVFFNRLNGRVMFDVDKKVESEGSTYTLSSVYKKDGVCINQNLIVFIQSEAGVIDKISTVYLDKQSESFSCE